MAAGRLVYYNGEFVPESEAKVSVFDSALMFGDMVFDMTRSFGGKQFVLSEHIDRIYAGIKMLRIPLTMTPGQMIEAVEKTIEANRPAFDPNDEHRIMIDVSRGPLAMYCAGFRRKDRADRHHQRLSGAMDRRAAGAALSFGRTCRLSQPADDSGRPVGAEDQEPQPAPLSDGESGCGAWSMIPRPGRCCWIRTDLLPRVRARTSSWSRTASCLRPSRATFSGGFGENTPCSWPASWASRSIECNLNEYDAINADEAFFTSTAFTLMPCVKVQGCTLSDGGRGPVTQKLIDAWCELVGLDFIAQAQQYLAEASDDAYSGVTMYRFGKGSRRGLLCRGHMSSKERFWPPFAAGGGSHSAGTVVPQHHHGDAGGQAMARSVRAGPSDERPGDRSDDRHLAARAGTAAGNPVRKWMEDDPDKPEEPLLCAEYETPPANWCRRCGGRRRLVSSDPLPFLAALGRHGASGNRPV